MKPVSSEHSVQRDQCFFDLSSDLLCVVDLSGRFVEANPSFHSLLGYDPAELIGCTFHAFIHPEDIGTVEDAIDSIRHRYVIRDLKARGFAADGSLHWFDISGRLADDQCVYVVSRNISEQVWLAEHNRSLETRLAATLNSMTDGFFMVDRGWRFSFVNPVAEVTLKTPARQLLGEVLWDCFPGFRGSLFEDHYRRAMDTGITAEFEAFFAPLTLWVEVRAYPGPEGLAVYFRNINERVVSGERLRLLERSISASMNGVLIVDARQPDNPITYANPAFERITGYTSQEVLGRNCRFLQGARTEEKARQTLREAIAQKREAHVIIGNYRKDGSLFWNELYVSPVQDEQGEVTHFVGIQNDISSLHEWRLELAYNSHHDALTALPNRALLSDRLKQATAMNRSPGQIQAIFIIELDHFRQLSEHLSVGVSDEILLEITERLRAQIHHSETLARLGADEFALLVPERSRPAIDELARHLLAVVSEPVFRRREIYQVTASIGYVNSADSMDDPEELMRRAEVARRQARLNGRNQIVRYQESLDDSLSGTTDLRDGLRQAMKDGHLSVVYQPQVNALTGQVVGVELLTRWQHPVEGAISPDRFIPIAETTGLIGPMTDWLLEQLIADIRELSQWCSKDLTFGINVSPLLLRTREFADRLTDALNDAGIAPQRIEIELTENILLDATELLSDLLKRLRRDGFRIAIDDFGTGFTGLSYLRDLPIDTLKIDRSFVRDIVLDGRDSTIVDSVVYLAKHMNMTVIAEGIESAAQARHLTRAGVNVFQGYLFSRPLSKTDPVHFLTASNPRPGYVTLPGTQTGNSNRLLIVDDDAPTRSALSRLFRREPMNLRLVGSYHEGLTELALNDTRVLICDLQSRSAECLSFLSTVKARYPELRTIVLSGTVSVSTVTEVINTGAVYRYLTKPRSDERLLEVVHQAFHDAREAEPLPYE